MSEKYNSRIEKREQAKEAKEKKKKKKNASDDSGAKKPKMRLWKKILLICFTLGCLVIIGAVGAFWWIVQDAPELDETLLKAPESSELLASDGTVFAEVGAERRYNITLDQVPDILIDAVLATEDVNFYDHFGVDIPRTIAAVWSNIFGDGITQGGSTITQQLARGAFLSREQTIPRKVQEWYLAVQLEQRFSKDDILMMYLNRNLYGGNVFGVAMAAQRFFGLNPDELDQLTLEQAALLAGIPQSPNRFNPSVEDNLERAQNRRNTVLSLMNRHGKLSEAEMQEAQSVPIEDTLNLQSPPNGQFQAFVDFVITEVQEKTDANIFEDGLQIHTTLNPEIQRITEDVISTNDFINFPDNDNLESAVAIVDTQTGAIQALGAGRNYQADGFNYATRSNLQPGSAAKPLLSYGPVINNLRWSTGHFLVDEEFFYSSGQVVGNQGRSYMGKQTIRFHLAQSTNVPAILANQAAGQEYSADFARSLGLPIAAEDTFNESNPLGTMSTASPLNMAGAYAAFGNGGFYIEPHAITKIVYDDGTERDVTPEPVRVMEDFTAYMVTDMLRDAVTSGTGTRANISGIDLAGKTGTTSFNEDERIQRGIPRGGARSAWFVGYTPQYTAAVWTGFSANRTAEDYLDTTRRRFSQEIFREIMSRVATSTERFERPSSVGEANGELYVVGGESVPVASLDPVTNLQARYDEDSDSIQLSWDHSSDANISFRVSYTVGGNSTTLETTSEMSASLSSPEVGSTYTFSVVAISGSVTSDPASISVTIPGAVEEEPEEDEEPTEEYEQPTEEDPSEDDTTDESGDTGDDSSDDTDTDTGNDTGNDTGGDTGGDTDTDTGNDTGGDDTDHDTSSDTDDTSDGAAGYRTGDDNTRITPLDGNATSFSIQSFLFTGARQTKNVGYPTFFVISFFFSLHGTTLIMDSLHRRGFELYNNICQRKSFCGALSTIAL